MSTMTQARRAPRTTAAPCAIIMSSVTGKGAVEAVDHHAERIPDQQQVRDGIEEPRHRRAIGGEADDRHAVLAGAQLGRGPLLLDDGDAHLR